MKKIILIILLTVVFSCKNEKKKNTQEPQKKEPKIEISEKVIGKIQLAPIDKWEFRGIEMADIQQLYNSEKVYEISRIESDYPYATVAINNVKLNYTGGKYRVSVLVKSGENGSQLGLRLQEAYPTRTDVVFDLKNGVTKEIFKKGDLTDYEQISIESLDGGWYRCSFTADIYSSYFKLVFGPTDVKKQVKIWEALTSVNSDLFIIPASLKIVELEND